MTTLASPGGSSRLTGEDLVRLKKYLIDNISRSIEAEGIAMDQREEFLKQRIQGIYEQANLKLPQDVRNSIFKESRAPSRPKNCSGHRFKSGSWH